MTSITRRPIQPRDNAPLATLIRAILASVGLDRPGTVYSDPTTSNSLYDVVAVDSDVERKFAEAISSRQDIKLFIKLPGWFMIPTPPGNYNPDWAIVKDGDETLYLVRETKGSKEELKLRATEWAKIQCGKAPFAELGVSGDTVVTAAEV